MLVQLIQRVEWLKIVVIVFVFQKNQIDMLLFLK